VPIVLTGAVVDPDETKPARVRNLPGQAQRVLTVCPDARRVVGSRKRDRDLTQYGCVKAGVCRRDVAGKFVEHAGRCERLPDHVPGRHRRSDPQAQPSDLAFDRSRRVVRNDSLREDAAGCVKRIDVGPRPDEARRRLDEPVVGQGKVVSCRGGNRQAARSDLLAEQARRGSSQIGAVEFLAHHDIGKETAMGGNQISAKEWHLELSRTAEIVGGAGRQITRRRAEVNVPVAPVEPGNVLTDLRAAERLAHAPRAVGVRLSSDNGIK
jgi:hypothetical protein